MKGGIYINIKERFLTHNIPYGDIDKEMLEIIDILNFQLGFKTEFCCFGHKNKDDIQIIFDNCVTDEMIERIALKMTNKIYYIGCFNKWLRKIDNNIIASNWIYQFGLEMNYTDRKVFLDKIVLILIQC